MDPTETNRNEMKTSKEGDRERSKERRRDEKRSRKEGRRERSRSRERRRENSRENSRERDRRSKRSSRSSRSPKRSHNRRSKSPGIDRIRKRKNNKWDAAPTEEEIAYAKQLESFYYDPNSEYAPNLSLNTPYEFTMAATSLLGSANFPMDFVKAEKQAKRLYVGNIPAGTTDSELITFLNTAIVTAGLSHSPTVLAVQSAPGKNFVFAEFANNDSATKGMALDGIDLKDVSLKIRRPKDYISSEPKKEVPLVPVIPGIVPTLVSGSEEKIFVGGIPFYLKEKQIKELVSAFGQLRSFNLVRDSNTGLSKGYAFYEYVDVSVVEGACKGLNGMKIGDKVLLVQKASLGTGGIIVEDDGGQAESTFDRAENPRAAAMLDLTIPASALFGVNSFNIEAPTKVLILLNMFAPFDLIEDNDYQDSYDDVLQECSKHGKVSELKITRPAAIDSEKEIEQTVVSETGIKMETKTASTIPSYLDGVGLVLVTYSTAKEAQTAQRALSGRKFQGRMIITAYYRDSLVNIPTNNDHSSTSGVKQETN